MYVRIDFVILNYNNLWLKLNPTKTVILVTKVVPEQQAETHPSVKYFFKKVLPVNMEMPGL